ncbi:hypothetical protein MBLNU457_g0550t1 [Dothideomycetes sp. NU457]
MIDAEIAESTNISSIFEDEPSFPTFSDDLDALHEQEAELTLEKTKRGIVIQHRQWNIAEVFRSDDDKSFALPSSQPVQYDSSGQPQQARDLYGLKESFSSDPVTNMPYISSPVAYPQSSSPPPQPSPKRKRAADAPRLPLTETAANKKASVFIEESDDDEDAFTETFDHLSKRPRLLSEDGGVALDVDSANTVPRFIDASDAVQDLDDYLATPSASQQCSSASRSLFGKLSFVQTTAGKRFNVVQRRSAARVSDEQLIAARSKRVEGKAQRSYYGIDIHKLLDEAKAEAEIEDATKDLQPVQSIEPALPQGSKNKKTLMWTEKYRARKFTDLIGDDRTHRQVMYWLKRWDRIVFPGSAKPKSKFAKGGNENDAEGKIHRKVLLLTGPPGLGKTTLAHVCAKQAGYEVQEINASDERSSNVVKGRIRDMVGTENVKGVDNSKVKSAVRKVARPVCVIVDEVDGVVTGSGGSGEGGFIKALVDLVLLDQKNSRNAGISRTATQTKKKGDNFKMLRPLVLICNDVYHPSLRPLRQSGLAEVIHVGKPQLNTVISRMQSIFDKESVPADSDGVRRLCEASWGITSRREGGSGYGTAEGDIRSIMVVSEFVAGRLRATLDPVLNAPQRLTRQWVEANILDSAGQAGGAVRGLGRGGSKEIVDRVFEDGAGLSKTGAGSALSISAAVSGVKGVAEANKGHTMQKLREMVDGFADSDRVVTDLFTAYPSQPYQDDTLLSKPSQAYDWLYFHDTLSSAVYTSSEWELAPYLSQSVLAFHHLFASSQAMRNRTGASTSHFSKNGNTEGSAEEEDAHPFTTPQASFHAHETQKANHALLQSIQSSLALPLTRMFPSPSAIATDLLPYILRMMSPAVTPVIVSSSSGDKSIATASVRKASEKALVTRSVTAMLASGVRFERARIENAADSSAVSILQSSGWVYRMMPDIEIFGSFDTGGKGFGSDCRGPGQRYGVRACLAQECAREEARQERENRDKRAGEVNGTWVEPVKKAKTKSLATHEVDDEGKKIKIKRDFFGRVVVEEVRPEDDGDLDENVKRQKKKLQEAKEVGRIWVTYHEGYSNAVRKPISLKEMMRGL